MKYRLALGGGVAPGVFGFWWQNVIQCSSPGGGGGGHFFLPSLKKLCQN